ncbi:uncharacterized protein [Lepeophtheirus salmonis]|uniref:uncharacterized protein n=1 Tax=Lepeophtheirus salmonis TaxID=72036 RepID=UPI001AE43CD6|nr:uncharacterized protein LOC121120483 [Lepeophtheirus salmonis]XP_040571304.1 uncharacterized protein LOC121120483 [Lepeophtheirus salmonis]XP_040571305.1 uncharacterized protein LOC121120483 [Lepeophtheirus salmonis]
MERITCKCKRYRCKVCTKCSRCGCDHNPKNVYRKIMIKKNANIPVTHQNVITPTIIKLSNIPITKKVHNIPIIKKVTNIPTDIQVPSVSTTNKIPNLPMTNKVPFNTTTQKVPNTPTTKKVPKNTTPKKVPSIPVSKKVPSIPVSKKVQNNTRNKQLPNSLTTKKVSSIPVTKRVPSNLKRRRSEAFNKSNTQESPPRQVRKIEKSNLDLIKNLLKISESSINSFPSEEYRHAVYSFDELQGGNLVISLIVNLLEDMCSVLIPNDSKGLLKAVALYLGEKGRTDSTLLESATKALVALPEKNTQRRVILSLICNSISFNDAKKTLGLCRSTYDSGKNHFRSITAGKPIVPTLRSVMRYELSQVTRAVEFILAPNNIKPLWGTRKMVIDDRAVEFPRFIRLKKQEHIYWDYVEKYTDRKYRLSHGSFAKLVKILTSFDHKALEVLDYTSGTLLVDNFALLKEIMSTMQNSFAKEVAFKIFEKMEQFLRHGYANHRSITLKNATAHDISHALGHTSSVVTCEECQLPFQVAYFVKKFVNANLHTLVDNCAEKSKLYMAHLIRVENQKQRLKKIYEGIEPDECLILMDYKKRSDPMSFGEKTVNQFGRQGLSWHGAMVYYRCSKEKSTRKVCYYDHISVSDTKQDWMAVLSIIEGIVMQLKNDLPHIKKVNIHSDNAKCYQNGNLIFGLFMLFLKNSLTLGSFIHTETQDGSSAIHSHFADCMQHVQNYMEMGMNILSPLELYVALTTNGGVVDTVVTMFELNRASIELFMQQFSDAFRHFSRIKQCNEILFSDKSVMIYEYSGVIPCKIDLSCPLFPSGEFFHSIEHFDDKIESEDDEEHDSIEDIIVFDQTEDEDDIPLDENFDGFCGTLTLCKFMKSITRYPNQLKKSKPNTQNSTALLDELLEFVDKKDELLCDTCNRNFSTEAKMTQHICKRIRSSNDLVSAAIKHAELFVREGNVNLDNIKKAYDVSIEKTNIEEQGMMDFFQDHLVGFSPSFFNKGWAVKHGYDKAYGFKYITKYKGDIDIMIEKGHKNQKNKMGPGKMREALQKMYPEQLDIPSETEIRERINSRSARRRRDSNIRHFEKLFKHVGNYHKNNIEQKNK